HGLFSEFHSVLGALAYGEAVRAAGVRVEFGSPLYVEGGRDRNWWTTYFEEDVMSLGAHRSATAPEVHLDQIVTKYGRHGGFSDVVQGITPYMYPMTYGISRTALHRLLTAHIRIRQEIRREAAHFVATHFAPSAYILGVHYRGTDATRKWTGVFNHYRTTAVPYDAYADEVRRVLDSARPSVYRIFVATDERPFLEFMQREFGNRVCQFEGSPRVNAGAAPVHLDRRLSVSNYQKGKSALVDALVLSATQYLIKGRSNLSDAALAFNPELPYSFYPDVSEGIVPLTRTGISSPSPFVSETFTKIG
ncbi:MAG TPA: hypothetical protein VLV86_16965, partial [Vicinamibacterales bacterium]|nr:hypothetical protein [Vicinamibacterales bacterium]